MNIKRKLTSLTAAVALAATTLVPIATSANAEPWNGGHRYGGFAHNDRGDYGRGGDYGHAAATAAGTTSTPTAGTSITTPASISRSALAP